MTRRSLNTVKLGLTAAAALCSAATALAQPANDACANATAVGAGAFPFTTIGATNDANGSCGASGTSPDVWFRYTSPVSGIAIINVCGADYDTVLSAFTGCGGTELVCNDDFCGAASQINVNVTAGVPVLVRVAGFLGDTGSGTITIANPATSAPANDNCANAAALPLGITTGSTSLATTDGSASCGLGGDTGGSDVWFTFTANQGGTAIIESCGSGFDTILSAYDSCGGSQIACNDDACGLQSRISFAVTNGAAYTVRLAGFNNATGLYTLNASISQAPANDNCSTAATASLGANAFNTTGASQDGSASCSVTATGDVWFRYTSPNEGAIRAAVTGLASAVTFFDSCGGGELRCGLNNATAQVTAGQTVLIRVAGTNAAFGAGTLTLTYFPVQGNDNCASAQVITAPSDTPFDTSSATNDGTGSCGASAASADIWYSYTPTADGLATITTCDASRTFDTVLAAFDSCGGSELACNDDNCGLGSTINVNVTGGVPILIRVTGFNGAVGQSILHLTAITGAPANDNCAAALPLPDGTTTGTSLLATDDGSASCGAGGDTGGSDVWYIYTPTITGTAVIDTCTSAIDTILTAFDSCGGSELACNDDACGLQSRIAFSVTAGTHYVIRVAGFNGVAGNYVLHASTIVPPANDLCENAQQVGEGSFPFNNTGAATEGSASCGFGGDQGSADIFFRYTATQSGLATIDTCGFFDTIVSVTDSCGGAEIACNDDGAAPCGALGSRVFMAVNAGTTYFIRVAGFNGVFGAGNLNIGVGPIPQPCLIAPPGSIPEGEACGEDTNGGCNNANQAFGQINSLPAQVFGQAFANGGTRDTDWYRFTIPGTGRNRVRLNVISEKPVQTLLLSDACPPAILVAGNNTAGFVECQSPAVATLDVDPGNYVAFVSPTIFDGAPCVLPFHYLLTVTAEPLGACCTGAACVQATQSDCTASGGQFRGAGTSCGGDVYAISNSTEAVIDISGAGTDITGSFSNPDDGFTVQQMGFDFTFFGASFNSVSVCTNGFLQFGDVQNVNFVNGAIPSPAVPNNCVYASWDDYNFTAAGNCFVQTTGTAPNRRFIVLWSNVPQFANTDSNTFEAILYEGTNNIEFRYGTITTPAAGDVTVGVENADGSVAYSLDATSLGSDVSVFLTRSVVAGACTNPCTADFDGSGTLDPDDLSSFITCYFSVPPCPSTDYDHNGTIDPDDLSTYITDYFDLNNGCNR